MKLINCPLNGPRNAQEFICGGEVVVPPESEDADIEEWADFIFLENNSAGTVREWWCHVASGYWFIAERNRTTDNFERTYPASDLFATPDAPESGS